MNAALFEEWVEKCLVPTLSQGERSEGFSPLVLRQLRRPAHVDAERPSSVPPLASARAKRSRSASAR